MGRIIAPSACNYQFKAMFSQQPDDRIESLGENQLIRQIRAWLGPVAPAAPTGIGDDCAVLQAPSPTITQLLTTDSLTYGQHFDDAISPQDAGAKLIKRNLSDIAAMGGQPGPALLNLLCGPDLSIKWLEQFVSGMRESCHDHGVTIVGGDVSPIEAGHFTAALSLTGSIEGKAVLRSTASIGDAIYVTGTLGGSLLGKHYKFEPRLKEGQWLAAQPACTAMMDLTDGLGKDLAALLPDESSATVDLEKLPVSADAVKSAASSDQSAEQHAFCDGEDYELLFAVAGGTELENFESKWSAQFPGLPLSHIGSIVKVDPAGRYLDASSGAALPWQSGFEHFKKI